ncbi:MAG: hypothetical protein WC455_21495 [Dehalococcoidia bacterium]|jgi:hypothetical protein
MKLRKGVPCPIAALAKKDKCLGSDCGWHLPDSEQPCLIWVQTDAILKLTELVETLTAAIEKREKTLDTVDDALKGLNLTLGELRG